MALRTFAIRAGIRRKYGDHEVYFELGEQVECKDAGEVKEAFLGLQSLLENQITVYEAVSLPHVRLPKHETVYSSNELSPDSFTLETIKVENSNGKKRIRACGGKWKQHGVPVYEECATDLPIETLSYGNHDFKHLNMTVKVDIVGGQPKRAVSIR